MHNIEYLNDLFLGKNVPALLVAEIGLNHLGDYNLARKMVQQASVSKADAVKFQIFKTENFYNPLLAKASFDLFKTFELNDNQWIDLKKEAEDLDLLFFATPLDMDSFNFLQSLKVPLIKIASSDMTFEPFLQTVAQSDSFVILSSGFIDEVKLQRSMSFFKNRGKLALLYCVSKYPCTPEDIDLSCIKTMKETLDIPIGFSDHSLGIHLSLGAVALGAKIIERHFTIDKNINGADNAISISDVEFKQMAVQIRDIEVAKKDGIKRITSFEKEISFSSMRSMYAKKDLVEGDFFSNEDILFLRPGEGVIMEDYLKLLNSNIKRNYKKYEKI